MTYRTNAHYSNGDLYYTGLPKWKLECDAIHPDEWKAIAKMVMDYRQTFLQSSWYSEEVWPQDPMNKYASGNDRDPL